MKTLNRIVAGLAWLAIAGGLRAAEWPARERIEAQGWTIGFAPADRAIAEGVMKQVPAFAKRMAALEAAKPEFGAEAMAARAGELAKKAALAAGLPGREADFRREFERAASAGREVETALHDALFLHAIELWRTAEVRERMGAGEQLPGFKWDPKENRPVVNFTFNWNVSSEDFRVTKTIDMPPAIFLRIERPDDLAVREAVAKDLEAWTMIVDQMLGKMRALAVRLAGPVAIGRVLKGAIASEPATTWVREGLAAYVWREVVRQSVSAKAAGNYAVMLAQIPVARAGDKPVNLEGPWEKDAEIYQLMARQVFLNIAESDGPAVLQRLLEAFWRLPVEERTSANLRRLYREQTKTGLEARAPRRSLGAAAK